MKTKSTATLSVKAAPRSLVIRASAGTGKTFQLTNCLLRLLLSGAPPRAILATTFTRKAAGEIQNRILERLAKATASEAKTQELAEELRIQIDSREKVVELLARLMRHIDQLRICTLDSYFQQAAQSFAFELNLPFGWSVLEDRDIERVQTDAVRRVLSESSPVELVNLMHWLDQGDMSWRVAAQIRQTIDAAHKTFIGCGAEAWKCVEPGEGLTPEDLKQAILELESLERVNGYYEKEKTRAIAAAVGGEFEYFLTNGVGKKIVNGEASFQKAEIPDSWRRVYHKFISHAQVDVLAWIAKKNEATAQLVSKFESQYQEAKRRRRQYEFDDIPRRLAETLASADSHRRLAFRLDAGIDHLLLDEFQDTSAEQWRVLAATAKRVCQQGSGDFLCVGDLKQAIYAWRGGSAQIFGAIEQQLEKVNVEYLVQSYRSAPEVIRAVNRVMEKLTDFAKSGSGAKEKSKDKQSKPKDSKDAAAFADWAKEFKAHSTAREGLPGWVTLREAAPAEEETGAPAKARLLGALKAAAELAKEVHAASPEHSIAILFRSNPPISRMVTLLRQNGIDASEEGGGSLLDSPAVETILSLIQLADHPGDSIARFHLETGPLGPRLANALVTPPLFAAEMRQSLLTKGYGAFVREWSERLVTSCSPRDANRLGQLIEIAVEYDAKATLRPRDFVTHVHKTKIKDVSASTVRVMTIHNSKGLEFDTVILPELDKLFATRSPSCVSGADQFLAPASRATRWVEEGQRPLLPASVQADHARNRYYRVQESLCTLYVAMTRAIHALHMIVPPPTNASNSKWSDLLRMALAKDKPESESTLLYSDGDPLWHRKATKGDSTKTRTAPKEVDWPTIAFSASKPSLLRNLPRVKPSMAATQGTFDSSLAFSAGATDATRFGTAIHFWFERLNWLGAAEILLFETELQAKGIALPSDDISAWRRKFDGYCELPSLRELLDEGAFRKRFGVRGDLMVQNEKSIAFLDENALLSGQIDRLVFEMADGKPVRAWIIDFKTDKFDEVSKPAIAKKISHHSVQLEAYRRGIAATRQLPLKSVEAYLVLLEAGTVAPLPT